MRRGIKISNSYEEINISANDFYSATKNKEHYISDKIINKSLLLGFLVGKSKVYVHRIEQNNFYSYQLYIEDNQIRFEKIK